MVSAAFLLRLKSDDINRGGYHVDYQLKEPFSGLDFGTRKRLNIFVINDLSATAFGGVCRAVPGGLSATAIHKSGRLDISGDGWRGKIASLLLSGNLFIFALRKYSQPTA